MKTEQPLRNHLNDIMWIDDKIKKICEGTKIKQSKKLQFLLDKQKNLKSYLSKNPIGQSKVNMEDSYVVIKSSKTFAPEQLSVLK